MINDLCQKSKKRTENEKIKKAENEFVQEIDDVNFIRTFLKFLDKLQNWNMPLNTYTQGKYPRSTRKARHLK